MQKYLLSFFFGEVFTSVSVRYLRAACFPIKCCPLLHIRTQNEPPVRRRIFRYMYIPVLHLPYASRNPFLPRVSLMLDPLLPPLSFSLSLICPTAPFSPPTFVLNVPVPQYLRDSGRFHSDPTAKPHNQFQLL